MKKLIAICLIAALASCSATKKTVTKKQSKTDSTATQSIQTIAVNTTDSAATEIDLSHYTEITEVVRVIKKGRNNITKNTHLQKKDTTGAIAQTAVSVSKEDTVIEREKTKIGFNFWWLLLLIPVIFLIFILPAARKKILFNYNNLMQS